MYFETDGIVLKRIKINNTDVFLTVFSKNLGKIQVFVKGASSPKSALNKASHPFVYGKFSLRGDKTFSLSNIDIISNFYNFREDLKRLAYGSYVLEFTNHSLNEDENNNQLYKLLLESLIFLSKTKDYEEKIKLYFDINALKALGYAPQLCRCNICGHMENFKNISVVDGGVICNKCSKNLNSSISIHPSIIKLIEYILNKPLSEYLKKEMNSLLVDKTDIFINRYIEYHLGLSNLKTRKFLKIY